MSYSDIDKSEVLWYYDAGMLMIRKEDYYGLA